MKIPKIPKFLGDPRIIRDTMILGFESVLSDAKEYQKEHSYDYQKVKEELEKVEKMGLSK